MGRSAVVELDEEKEAALRDLDGMDDAAGDALAMRWWSWHLVGAPAKDKPFPALAGMHKARLRWAHATKKQVQASKRWLRNHGYRETVLPREALQ
jgi:hypothetical protein